MPFFKSLIRELKQYTSRQDRIDTIISYLWYIRRNATHLHNWEYDAGEWGEFGGGRISNECWTCDICLATNHPKHKPWKWSLFHRWN